MKVATEPAFDWGGFWSGVGVFLDSGWAVPVRIVAIVVGAIVIRGLLQLVIRRAVDRVISGVKGQQNAADAEALVASPLAAVRVVQRTRALGGVLRSTVTTLVVIVALILIISAIDPGATGAFALITAALGAGLGFGAQNVVRDVLSGLFMVAEDQLGVGDIVDLGSATGIVEAVGIRITTLRDVNGTLWYVRNGEILRVGNMSQGWARVIIDLAVPYDADIEGVQSRMLDTAVRLRDEGKWKRLILERPEIWGIESISAEAVVIRLVVKTRAGSKDDLARELRARLKRALDDLGVRLPKLNSIVLSGSDAAASVTGARPPKTTETPVVPGAGRPATRTGKK